MEKEGLYLLTIGQILENTKNISNISLYYNRISIINNLKLYENNYCWVHETKSQFKKFTDTVSCACVEPKNELDLTILTKGFKCPQECYVRNLSTDLCNTNLIVDFSSSQCISLIYKGHLYLYSNLSTCKLTNSSSSEKESSRGIICEDCKIGEAINFSKEDIEKALVDIIERGEDQKYGLTLLEHTSLGSTLYGLEKVQDSVKSIGILEGLIEDETKQSNINNINVIDCDILLDDVINPVSINCKNHTYTKLSDCSNCNYINDLNKYLNSPILSYCDHDSASCEHSTKSCDNSIESCNHSLSGGCSHIVNEIGESNVISCDHMNGNCEHNTVSCIHRSVCEKCNIKCNQSNHIHKDCKIKQNCESCHCIKCIHKCVKCENESEKINYKNKINKNVNRQYLLECINYANELIKKATNELESICSSLINQINTLCQPPLNISIRFLEHFLCFEYLIEYSCDINHLNKDSLYDLNTINKENVILHEFIQSNILSKQIIEHTFNLILTRIKTYTTQKISKNQLNEESENSEMKIDEQINDTKENKDEKNLQTENKNELDEIVTLKLEEQIKNIEKTNEMKEDSTGRSTVIVSGRIVCQTMNSEKIESTNISENTNINNNIEEDNGINERKGRKRVKNKKNNNTNTNKEVNINNTEEINMNHTKMNESNQISKKDKNNKNQTSIKDMSKEENKDNENKKSESVNSSTEKINIKEKSKKETSKNKDKKSKKEKSEKVNDELMEIEINNVTTPSERKGEYTTEEENSCSLNETKIISSSEIDMESNKTINTIEELNKEKQEDQMEIEETVKESEEKNEESDHEETVCPEIYPYWWSFYEKDNTLGEGDINGRYEGIRRLTRSSYNKEESSTPKNKKTGNGANYLLTRCVSSDFSTKSNINVSGLHSSRETLCPSEFNQSQPSDSTPKVQICFCKTCIPFISNITRIFPNMSAALTSRTETKQTNTQNASSRVSDVSTHTTLSTDKMAGISLAESTETIPKPEIDSNNLLINISAREEEMDKEMTIVNGLRRSIRVALDVGTAIRKKIKSEHKPLMDTLNVALLSSFRLGEFLFNNTNMYGSSIYTNGSMDMDNRYDTYKPEGLIEKIQMGEQQTGNRTPELGDNESKSEQTDEEIENFLCIDMAVDSIETERSTFESDQYLAYDIVSEEDACSYSSLSSNSPKMFNKRKSPSRSRRPYRSLSSFDGIPGRRSFEGIPTSRRSTRELSQTDDMYIYDMNNLSDKGEFEDWYVDSDSSKKSSKYAHKRMPPSRPSVSNLTEIYGSQDMLIPMGPLPIGVYFDASRKLWRCQWRENGKFRTKGFSLGHYNTLADARHACILFRCQVGNMSIQPEWLTPNYIKVSDLLNRRAAQPSSTPKKSNRKKKRQEDMYETYT